MWQGDEWVPDTSAVAPSIHSEDVATLDEAVRNGLFGPSIGDDPQAASFIRQLFAARGISESSAIQAAKEARADHRTSFGQDYTPASSLSRIFDHIFSRAGAPPAPELATMPGWSDFDAAVRGHESTRKNDEASDTWRQQTAVTAIAMLAAPFAAAGLGAGAAAGAAVPAAEGVAVGGAAGAGTAATGTTAAGTGAAGGFLGTGVSAGTVSAGASLAGLAAGAGEFGDGSGTGYTNTDGSTFDPTVPYDDPGFTGPGQDSTTGYSPDPNLLQAAAALAKEYGITTDQAMKMLVSGGAGGGSLLEILGRAAPGIAGAFASNEQAKSLKELAEKYMALGAPSRARYESSFAPGFDMASDPGYKGALDQAAKATQHALSVNGNPAGSPNAWATSLNDLYAKTAYPALQNFRNTNANAGGIASLQTAAPAAATGAINQEGNVFNALGDSAASIFNPKRSLAEQLAELRRQGLY